MDNSKLKSAISRIMSDLIKLDSLITASELTFLDEVYSKYDVSDQDRKMGFYMTLAEAINIMSEQPPRFRKSFYELMKKGSVADGTCSRTEALLLIAVSCVWGLNTVATGRVLSYESRGIPLHRDQLIYVSKEDRIDRIPLSDDNLYEDINNISRIAGFELVYVPRIARHFQTYEKTEILKKVLVLVRPTLDRSEDELIRQLRAMTPYKFYTTILTRRMKMIFDLDTPCWLLKLGGSQVTGVEYANFLLLDINQDEMKKQLNALSIEFLKMQAEHMVSISTVEEDPNIFRYGGFVKSILDMITLGTDDRWDVVIRLRGCKEFNDGDGQEQKAAITIRRGDEEWPLVVPDRDAAFYVLILCATAEDPGGVFMSKDLEAGAAAQRRYEEIYREMSVREDKDCPNIRFSDTRVPIKSRLRKIIQEHNYLTEKDLYQLSSSQKKMFVVLNPSNVFVQSKTGKIISERPLKESSLYAKIIQIVD